MITFEGRFFQENLSTIHLSQRELPQILPCEILSLCLKHRIPGTFFLNGNTSDWGNTADH